MRTPQNVTLPFVSYRVQDSWHARCAGVGSGVHVAAGIALRRAAGVRHGGTPQCARHPIPRVGFHDKTLDREAIPVYRRAACQVAHAAQCCQSGSHAHAHAHVGVGVGVGVHVRAS